MREKARSWRRLDPIAEHDEAQHQGKRRESENDHRDGQHGGAYDTNQATAAITTSASATRHPARDHGHTGESMYGLSYSMSRAYGRGG